jgi:hypothetical protein
MITPKTASLSVVLLIIALALLAYGLAPSGAWYLGSWSTAGFILTSGSLDLHVTGDALRATNLQPGTEYTLLGTFCLENTGTIDLKYRGMFESPAPLVNDLLQYLTLKAEQQTGDSWSIAQEIPGTGAIATETLLYYFKHPGQGPDVVNHYVVAGSLVPGESGCHRLSVLLDPATPDSEQGKFIEFALHLDASQVTNPLW